MVPLADASGDTSLARMLAASLESEVDVYLAEVAAERDQQPSRLEAATVDPVVHHLVHVDAKR